MIEKLKDLVAVFILTFCAALAIMSALFVVLYTAWSTPAALWVLAIIAGLWLVVKVIVWAANRAGDWHAAR